MKKKIQTFEVHRFEGERNRIGYARVSKNEQSLDSQLDALQAAGCHMVISEKISSVAVRAGWSRVVETLRPGDLLVVTRLDRIGRRLREIIVSVQDLVEQGTHVRALAQGIDTSAPGGSVALALFAALAETERTVLRERTREGLAAAKARGQKIGRPSTLDPANRELLRHLRAKGFTIKEIAKSLKVGRTTVHRALVEMAKEDPRQLQLLTESVEVLPALPAKASPKKKPAKRAKKKRAK